MAIQMRRGLKIDFDPQKMLPGEWAVSIDSETENQIIWMCFRAGIVKRMGTYEDFKEQIREATDDIREEYKQTFDEIKVYMESLRDATEEYKDAAVEKAVEASNFATQASQSASNASANATNASNSADLSEDYSKQARSYAKGTGGEVRPNDDSDCAEFYYEQTKRISQSVSGIIPMGTIAFAELSDPSNQNKGYMFDISDEFISDERFKNGSGIYYGAGSNVIYTADGMWDVLAPNSVMGVKGNQESIYRQGFVNITPEDIGAATLGDISGVSADFVGTKEELEEKIASGEVKENMTAYVTDDDSGSGGSIDIMGGATASKEGDAGLVPAQPPGSQKHFLCGDGTWRGFVTAGSIDEAELGYNATAEGTYTEPSGLASHSEGYETKASGSQSHSEGYKTIASGNSSHAGGSETKARGNSSQAVGSNTDASNTASFACGKFNAQMDTGGEIDNSVGTAFVVGNGLYDYINGSETRSNAFSVSYTGVVKAKSTITASTTADYAEFFEWKDGNPGKEDRVGRFVTLDGDEIVIANTNEEYILGIISGEPFVLGNGDCDTWNGMYLRDDFNRTIFEPVPKIEVDNLTGIPVVDEETGKIKQLYDKYGNAPYGGIRPKINPEYDQRQVYVSRLDRPEWDPVGMVGILSVLQDGTCETNGYCRCTSGGIATACNEGEKNSYRVIKIISKDVARVVLK